MTIRIAGIDIGFTSSNPTALAIVEFSPRPALLFCATLPPEGKGWEAAILSVGTQINRAIEGKLLDAIAYELPHVQSNAQTAIKLAHLGGIVHWIARASSIPAIGVQPTQAKKALARSGAATKQQMMVSAHALFGARLTEHEADACGGALAGVLLANLLKQEA